jgi:hypothetical protein
MKATAEGPFPDKAKLLEEVEQLKAYFLSSVLILLFSIFCSEVEHLTNPNLG